MVVTNLKIINKKGIKALASVRIDSVIINQFRVISHKIENRNIVDVPLLHWVERGQHYYEKAVEIDEDLLNEIEKEILKQYDEKMKSGKY